MINACCCLFSGKASFDRGRSLWMGVGSHSLTDPSHTTTTTYIPNIWLKGGSLIDPRKACTYLTTYLPTYWFGWMGVFFGKGWCTYWIASSMGCYFLGNVVWPWLGGPISLYGLLFSWESWKAWRSYYWRKKEPEWMLVVVFFLGVIMGECSTRD